MKQAKIEQEEENKERIIQAYKDHLKQEKINREEINGGKQFWMKLTK